MAKKPVKDVFGLWQIEGETNFSDNFEFPCIKGTNKIPDELILFSKTHKISENTNNKAIHFYEFDEKFVNQLDQKEKLDFLIKNLFSKFQSVILPDFSVYYDFPLALQIFQIYKSRAIGSYLEKNGINVIPNVRWGDKRSYTFAFEGIKKHSIIAIGVLGGYRDSEAKENFENGFYEMLKILKKLQNY